MITLLMISAGVAAVLLVRLVSLLRQIPDRNEDFDVFHLTDLSEVESEAAGRKQAGLDRPSYFRQSGKLREQGNNA